MGVHGWGRWYAYMTCEWPEWVPPFSQKTYVSRVTCRPGLEPAAARRREREVGCRSVSRTDRAGGSPRARAPRTHDPRGPWPSAPTSGRRRCRGAAPGGSAALGGSPTPRTRGARVVSTFGNVVGQRDAPVLASCWTGCGVRNRFDRMRSAPGVPGADRPWGDRAAVPCRPVTHAGARSHDVPAVRHTLQRSHAWFPSRSAPGWHGHRYQRSPAGRGHVPYG